jgi:hypothetical protein
MRIRWVLLGVLLLGMGLAACKRDKGDPEAISRDFLLAVFAGDADRVSTLTCQDYRATSVAWAEQEADPVVEVDADHLAFETVQKADNYIKLQTTGVVTLTMPDIAPTVRSMEGVNTLYLTLIDEDGWKVCAVQVAKGDPVEVAREFMLAVWAGNVDQAAILACGDYRAAAAQWAAQNDPGAGIDASQLRFEVLEETGRRVEVVMSGSVTFEKPGAEPELRRFEGADAVQFTLVDEDSWKVCQVQPGM